VWVKDAFSLSRQDYHYQHEPILYGWSPTGGHTWVGDRKQASVLRFPKPSRSKHHPTMKPIELIEGCISNNARPRSKAIVLDPFGGSGSTLMACALNGWRGRLSEIDPRYCDVIRKRWTTWADAAEVDAGPGALR